MKLTCFSKVTKFGAGLIEADLYRIEAFRVFDAGYTSLYIAGDKKQKVLGKDAQHFLFLLQASVYCYYLR